MLVLCLVKLVATVISYCSGNTGGIFAPSLFIGAMAGGAVGTLVNSLSPFPTADPGAYALVGMGTLFAGIIRAPLTSVFMIFEITQDYQIMVPLMVANLLSFTISRRYQPVPVYEALLRQDGIHLPSSALKEPAGWTAGDVMNTHPTFFPAEMSIDTAWNATRPNGLHAYLIGTREHLHGVIGLEQLAAAREKGHGDETVGSAVGGSFPHVHPDHPLDVVLNRFAASAGLLPVVSRATARHVVGVIMLDDIRRFGNHRGEVGGRNGPVDQEASVIETTMS
jgi:CIC family chloride channel protein